MLCNSKVKTAACGRRWGKSESVAIDIAVHAISYPGSIQMVIAPTDDQTRIIMQQVSHRLHHVERIQKYLIEKHSPYWSIEFKDQELAKDADALVGLPKTRRYERKQAIVDPTQILARTAGPDGKGLRGRRAHRVIVDEAAFVPDSVMDEVVTPLLADYNGQLVLISTPSGRNHFWRAFERGLDSQQQRYSSFQFPTSANPHIPAEYIENERLVKPERIFKVEYEAVFADAEGQVFRHVEESCDGEFEPAREGRYYVAGVDLARVNDFSVTCVIDVESGRLVALDRYNKVDWPIQKARIVELLHRYNDAGGLMEVNHVGDVILDDVRRMGANLKGFATTSKSKPDLIDGLAVAFEQGSLKLPKRSLCTVLVDELQSYQYTRTAEGNYISNAPDGKHDDCVIALALAWRAAGIGRGRRAKAY